MNNFERRTSGHDRASNIFEERYNPSNIGFNLERIRTKNIAKVKEIASEISEINGRYKSQLIRNIYSGDYSGMTEQQKDQTIMTRLREVDNIIDQELQRVKYAVRDEIIHQAKMLLLLANKGENKKVFDYYKLINTMPMIAPYSDYEKNLYREFIMQHPSIENIIVSFSELEEEQQQLNNNTAHINNNNDDDINRVIEALNNLETSIELQDWLDAKNLIAQLPEGEQKLSFYRRYRDLLNRQTAKFDDLLATLNENMESNLVVDIDLVNELSKRFKILDMDKKAQVKDSVDKIIHYSNACVQDTRKESIASSIEEGNHEKYSFGTMILEFLGMPINWIRRSHSYLKHIVSRRDKAIENGKQEKAARLNKIYLERDTVSGPIYYRNINKLNSMKPVLYRNGFSRRSNKIQGKYFKAMASVYNKMNKSVDYMTSNDIELSDIIGNKERAIKVVNQYMEMISLYDVNRIGSIENDGIFSGLIQDLKDLLIQLKNNDTFDENLYLAYLEEIDNIVAYKESTTENRGYEYYSDDINDISNDLSELPHIKVR